MNIKLPELSLVVLIGASGAGKSTFARQHFLPSEVLSSDTCRGLVSDDEGSMDATADAFEVLHFIAAKRLKNAKLTVIDATNVQPEARASLLALAREYHVFAVAIVLDVPERVCHERNESRPDRNFGPHVVRNHVRQLRRSMPHLRREGFRHVWTLQPDDLESLEITRERLWNNRRDEHGPFDIIGDVHGCADELETLLKVLGYAPDEAGVWRHTDNRRAVFLGDLVDRGPRVGDVLKLVMAMCQSETALCIPGNHDIKLMRALKGEKVKIAYGLAESLAQLEGETPEFRERMQQFIDGLVSHYVLDDGKLVVAHAGLKEAMQGRGSGAVRAFCLYGETTGETDEFGLPVRYPWAGDYRGKASVVYGHTPIPEPEWLNNTINIDTGCVFGGKLSALRWPEREVLSVPARQTYAEPSRPFLTPQSTLSAQHQHDDLLDIADVIGKRIIDTGTMGRITIREENALAALEVMSRFAADSKWLIYLPPTMSPCETSSQDGFLEHPAQAFAYFRREGVAQVVCEEKHMGSRAVVVVCRDAEVARERFGITTGESGIITTRTGRRFFDDLVLETALLDRLRAAMDAAHCWEEWQTDWACLDCELMPWSAKAQELVRGQYAPVGVAAQNGARAAHQVLSQAVARGLEVGELEEKFAARETLARDYVAAYQRYCWDVHSIEDYKLAPFHLLATEGRVHTDRDHGWHMETLVKVCERDPKVLLATPFRLVDVESEESCQAAIGWWLELTSRGGEGMVVKPFDFIARHAKGTGKSTLVQPAIKCRGREYLRIIYGPEYTLPENLDRLRSRGLAAKRALALREFALGIEALERFVAKEPLRRVHECVFGVLALESEPVDPRL